MPDLVSGQKRPVMPANARPRTCQVCGENRSDRTVSVMQVRMSDGITDDVRYCSDRPECRRLAHLGHERLFIRRSRISAQTADTKTRLDDGVEDGGRAPDVLRGWGPDGRPRPS